MYFIKFSNCDVRSNDKMTHKDFSNKMEALRWLFANGFKADCVPAGGNPFDSNMFWNDDRKVSAMGWNY